jgi:colicin import membrane protein
VIRDEYNIIPVTTAALLHVVIFGGLVVALDFVEPSRPQMPLAIEATLVTEAELPPPVVEQPQPEPEPEPQPEPEPDASEAERQRLEEEKRQADLRAEQERIRLQQEEDRRRREREESERKRREEEELERQRTEAERKRQEDMERQRAENERLRREAEEAQILRRQQQEIEAEERRLLAMQADDQARWIYALQNRISRNFIPPASTPPDLECIVDVRQLPGGSVVSVAIGRCNGDESVRRAIEAAVFKASPLPPPDNPAVFERDLRIRFKPEQ